MKNEPLTKDIGYFSNIKDEQILDEMSFEQQHLIFEVIRIERGKQASAVALLKERHRLLIKHAFSLKKLSESDIDIFTEWLETITNNCFPAFTDESKEEEQWKK